MTPKAASQRAARGARYLDKHRPGWAGEIDKRNLDMQSAMSCIMGQIGNHASPEEDEEPKYYVYNKGFIAVDLSIEEAQKYGFELSEGDYNHTKKTWTAIDESYAMLQCAWITEIDKRVTV
jgi:hypothetical protein